MSASYAEGRSAHWLGLNESPTINFASPGTINPNAGPVSVNIELPDGWSIDGGTAWHWVYPAPGEVARDLRDIVVVPQHGSEVIATFSSNIAGQTVTQRVVVPVDLRAVVFNVLDDVDEPGTLRWLLTGGRTAGAQISFDQDAFALVNHEIQLTDELVITHDVSLAGYKQPNGHWLTFKRADDSVPHRFITVEEDGNVELNQFEFWEGGGPLEYGGAILNKGLLTVENSVFFDNYGFFGGAIGVTNGGRLIVGENSLFEVNMSAQDGGAIALGGSSTAFINGADFWDNLASSNAVDGIGGKGGAIYIGDGSALEVIDSYFERNRASKGDFNVDIHRGSGGAIYAATNSTVSITGGTFLKNYADRSGGAISNAGNLTIAGTVIAKNEANEGSGGGIYNHVNWFADPNVSRGNLYITGTSIVENEANDGFGGGLAAYSENEPGVPTAIITIENSTISENTSKYGGSGIDIGTLESTQPPNPAFDVTIAHSTIVNNETLTAMGGGISSQFSDVKLRNTIVSRNEIAMPYPYSDLWDWSATSTKIQSLGWNWIADIQQNEDPFDSLPTDRVQSGLASLSGLSDAMSAMPTHAAASTLAIVLLSDCLGVDDTPLEFDQLGKPRGVDGEFCTVGAVEHQP